MFPPSAESAAHRARIFSSSPSPSGTAGLGVLAYSIWRRRPRRRAGQPSARFGRWVGVVAALSALGVHSAFDFLWHIPLIPLIGAALVGMVLADPPTEVTE